jgi:hypothetical protein
VVSKRRNENKFNSSILSKNYIIIIKIIIVIKLDKENGFYYNILYIYIFENKILNNKTKQKITMNNIQVTNLSPEEVRLLSQNERNGNF